MVRRGLETKSCRACAAAKRKCEKQVPVCARCKKRGVDCKYPASKQTAFVLCDGEEDGLLSPRRETPLSFNTSMPPAAIADSLELQIVQSGSRFNSFIPGLELALPNLLVDSLSNSCLASTWFTSIDTWEVRFPNSDQILPVNTIELKEQVVTIFRWFSQWIDEGGCPFIHPELYHERFPKCLQEAYVIWSSYIHRTPSNEPVIFRIIEEHVMTLVRVQSGVKQSSARPLIDESSGPPLDAPEHLARVYALLIYQAIGLYNGDIRLRHIAERHIPVLESWMQQLLLHTRETFFLGASIIIPSHVRETVVGHTSSGTTLTQNLLWNTWILADSIRRTWIVASGLQSAYLMAREGHPVGCQGGMMFTTRKGVWEAKSAAEWENICCEVNVGLIQMTEVNKIMTSVSPDEVNEFTKFIIDSTLGKDSIQTWLASK